MLAPGILTVLEIRIIYQTFGTINLIFKKAEFFFLHHHFTKLHLTKVFKWDDTSSFVKMRETGFHLATTLRNTVYFSCNPKILRRATWGKRKGAGGSALHVRKRRRYDVVCVVLFLSLLIKEEFQIIQEINEMSSGCIGIFVFDRPEEILFITGQSFRCLFVRR